MTGSVGSRAVQGMLPGRRYDGGGRGDGLGMSGSDTSVRSGGGLSPVRGSVNASVAMRKPDGSRFAVDMDIPQFHS